MSAECREEFRTLKDRTEETEKTHCNRVWDLQQLERQRKHKESIVRGYQETIGLIQRFFPGVISAMPPIRDCIEVKMPDNLITMLLDGKPRSFKSGAILYDPDEKNDVNVGDVEAQIKQDPTDENNYRLHLGGKRIFKWFKEKWQSLKQAVKKGFRI